MNEVYVTPNGDAVDKIRNAFGCFPTKDDLISRQAAINAADRADYTGLTVEDVKKVTDEVVKELKQLPSAQPEQTKMIKEIREWINSGNRGSADYFIVDKIEEIINKYERRYSQPTGGD